MEPFSLLKYWRPSASIDAGGEASSFTSNNSSTLTTIVTAVNSDEESGDDDDEGPFFDLEFAVPCEENRGTEGNAQGKTEEENREIDSDDEEGVEFDLSSGSSGDGGGVEQSDPSDDLFFKGRLVSIDTSSSPTNGSEQNSKSLFLQKSANRLRILMLKLKKSKCNEIQKSDANGSAPVGQNHQGQNQESSNKPPPAAATASKFFTVKFKVEEVPIISLFTRDGSKSQKQPCKQIDREIPPAPDSALSSTSSDDKRYSKELLMQKYLNKVKPLYVHVSRRYAEKLKLGSEKPAANEDKDSCPAEVSSESANVRGQKQGNLQAGLKVVYKHLGKSRSASSAAATSPFVAAPSRRCDDSLMDQQDGIQGAILHCKRSFNSSRDPLMVSQSVAAGNSPGEVHDRRSMRHSFGIEPVLDLQREEEVFVNSLF